MIKIFNTDKVREADSYTIKNEPISSIDLMERAGDNCTDWLIDRIPDKIKIKIFVGQGNNGGDGLVIARKMLERKYDVEVNIIKFTDKYSIDFSKNLDRLEEKSNSKINTITKIEELNIIQEGEVVIDAIFGSGLTRPIEGFIAQVVSKINESQAVVVSIDIPSGLFADKPIDEKKDAVVQADFTLSLQFPKMSYMFAENEKYVGLLNIIPIGLHPVYINETPHDALLIEHSVIQPLFMHRTKFSHKGHFGHALLVSGSYGKMGAAVLASKACLRSGVGLLTTHIPHTASNILQTSVPEAMLSLDKSELGFSELPDLQNYNVIGIGPGLGMNDESKSALKLLIQEYKNPIVFDADALNILAENKTWLSFIPEMSIITPHPKEFERLAGSWDNGFEMIEKQKEFARKYNIIVVVKGANTSICTPEGELFFNTSGNPGMATAGSGDVLTGVILGLKAQGYPSGIAAILGVFIHGLAGDLALQEQSVESLIAGDIIDYIGDAFNYNPDAEKKS